MLIKLFKKIYSPWNLLILIILLLAFILRIYRIEALLDFHYDQGRDAKIIWDLWHSGKFFLIGPTTGLDGIFLGPIYYYLIAPFYLLGAGNPVVPSMFLSLLTVLGLYILYLTGLEIGGRPAGFIALVIGSFSNFIIFSSRWLSNPTPIYLTSISIFYLMVLILKNKKNYYWYLIYFLVGISLQFELASAVFYLPILLVFTIWQRQKISFKVFFVSCLFLTVTLIPQLWFNFKHDNILFTNAMKQFGGENNVKINIFKRLDDIWKIIEGIF
jgi:4-amino-4-deoxy-L-arabinose transferase-like glycosyltransferase